MFLQVLTGMAGMLVLSLAAQLLGRDRYLAGRGVELSGLLITAAFSVLMAH